MNSVAEKMTDYEMAKLIATDPLYYVDCGRRRLLEAAWKYVEEEDVRRKFYFGITTASYEAWRAFVSELGI